MSLQLGYNIDTSRISASALEHDLLIYETRQQRIIDLADRVSKAYNYQFFLDDAGTIGDSFVMYVVDR